MAAAGRDAERRESRAQRLRARDVGRVDDEDDLARDRQRREALDRADDDGHARELEPGLADVGAHARSGARGDDDDGDGARRDHVGGVFLGGAEFFGAGAAGRPKIMRPAVVW